MIALVAVVAALVATAGTAYAADPVQSTTQSSSTGQDALAASSATQVEPSNQNISVRVLSPGDDGAVSQSNEAASSASATNTATTTQSASQALAPSCGCAVSGLESGQIDSILPGALQAASDGSAPDSSQAAAPAAAPALAPAPASAQSNEAASSGTATNAAPTTQTATQSAPAGGGVQASKQDASTEQGAVAASSAEQIKPSNSNISVRVLSPGDDGSVTQQNRAASSADATNTATTTQSGTQTGGGSGVQSSTQSADTQQLAAGLSSAKQVEPENSNVSVRVLSPGGGGSVYQKNAAESSASATNTAPVTQTSTQSSPSGSCGCEPTRGIVVNPCGCDGSHPGVQAVGQSSEVGQAAGAASSAFQLHPSNANDPVRIGSWGNDGTVKQENEAASSATSTNTAPVTQTARQWQDGGGCGCSSGPAVQALGQTSKVGQLAGALSSAAQIGASNESGPVRIDSPGNGGSVWQENEAGSSASATNTAPTTQSGTQAQWGSGVQALGQKAETWQKGIAVSSALQLPGKSRCGCGGSFGNTADPVRVWSKGDDGSVWQRNAALSRADVVNTATPTQTATQTQSGSRCACQGLGVQAVGQLAHLGQFGLGLSSAEQVGAANAAGPIRLWSENGGTPTRRWSDVAAASPAGLGRIPADGTLVPV